MDEYKFKPLEDWLGRVREADCDSFFVMATNNKNKIVANCQCDVDTLATMLLNAARQDKEIALAIVTTATIITKREEEKQKDCRTCEFAGVLGSKRGAQVAHCALEKQIHRLPYSCQKWQQREEKGDQQ